MRNYSYNAHACLPATLKHKLNNNKNLITHAQIQNALPQTQATKLARTHGAKLQKR